MYKVATPDPNPQPVQKLGAPSGGPLPDWWAVVQGAGSGQVISPSSTSPITNAVQATDYLPLCYGQIRVAVAPLVYQTLNVGSSTWREGMVLLGWCEGPIQSIDAVYCNGSAVRATFPNDGYQQFTHDNFMGVAGELNGFIGGYWDASLGRLAVANNVAATFLYDLITQNYAYGTGGWWSVFGGAEVGTTLEFSADVHGCLLYDPRLDSTNGGTGLQRENDPTTWTYSNNPILEWRDARRRAANQNSSTISDASVIVAANASDTAGFSCNIAFVTQTTLDNAVATILQTCNGVEIDAGGKIGVFVDTPNAGAPVGAFDESAGDIFALTYQWLSVRDRYTQMAVSFNNKDAGYVADQTPLFGDPGTFSSEPTVTISSATVGTGTLHLALSPGWSVNDTVIFFQNGGTAITGMNDGQTYYVKSISGADVTLSAVSGGALNTISGSPVLTTQYLQRVGALYPPTVAVKSQVVNAPGINTLAAAIILRDYLYNIQAISFRINGSMNSRGILLQVGQKITLTTLKLAAAEYLLTQIQGDAVGYSQFVVRPYAVSAYGSTPVSVAPPTVPPSPPDTTAPPPPAAPRVIGMNAVAMDAPRVYTVAGPYGAALWAVTGATTSDTSKINDGDATVAAVVVADSVASLVVLDLGAGNTAAFGRFDFWTNVAASVAFTLKSPLRALEYSDDGSTWLDALTSGPGADQTCVWQSAAAGGIYPQHVEVPSSIGTHRYWRLTFFVNGGGSVYEIQASTFAVWAGTPTGYELRTWPGGGPTPDFSAPSLAQPVITSTTTLPTDAAPLTILATLLISSTGDAIGGVHTVESGAVDTLSSSARPSTLPVPFYSRQDAIPSFKPPPVFGNSGGGVIMEVPAGVIDGTNTVFTLTYQPSQPRILLVVDGQTLIGGVDYSRVAKVVTLKGSANPPRVSVYAIYTTADSITYPIPGTPEAPTAGTAATWNVETISAGNWQHVCWSPQLGIFVATRVHGSASTTSFATSPDGVTWTTLTTASSLGVSGICWNGSQFVAVVNGDPFNFYWWTSSDGVTWNLHSIGLSGTHVDGDGWAAVSWNGSVFCAVQWGNVGTYTGQHHAATSSDGVTWAFHDMPGAYYTDVCWSPAQNIFVAVGATPGGYNIVATSPDGITWTARTPASVAGASRAVVWVAELGLFVAAGIFVYGEIATSPDGVTWTSQVTGSLGSLGAGGLCWSAARQLLVVGGLDSGVVQHIRTSYDAITWTVQAAADGYTIYGLAAATTPDMIVAVGNNTAFLSLA